MYITIVMCSLNNTIIKMIEYYGIKLLCVGCIRAPVQKID